MTALPAGLTAGTYTIDPSHTSASFVVRHAGISKVRGEVAVTSGTITIGEDIESSTVTAELDATTVNTGAKDRDGHLNSPDFFDTAQFPTWTFTSTSVAPAGDAFAVTGDLTLHGVTRPVLLTVEYTGTAVDPFGNTRAAFEGRTEISRKDFGLTWNTVLEAGGVLVSDAVKIELDVSAIKG